MLKIHTRMHDISKKFWGGLTEPFIRPLPPLYLHFVLGLGFMPKIRVSLEYRPSQRLYYVFVFLTDFQTNLRNIFRHRLRHCGTHCFRFHFHAKIIKSCAYKLYLYFRYLYFRYLYFRYYLGYFYESLNGTVGIFIYRTNGPDQWPGPLVYGPGHLFLAQATRLWPGPLIFGPGHLSLAPATYLWPRPLIFGLGHFISALATFLCLFVLLCNLLNTLLNTLESRLCIYIHWLCLIIIYYLWVSCHSCKMMESEMEKILLSWDIPADVIDNLRKEKVYAKNINYSKYYNSSYTVIIQLISLFIYLSCLLCLNNFRDLAISPDYMV